MELNYEVEGFIELTERLDLLNEDVRFKGGRFAMRKAANLLRDAAQLKADQLDDWNTEENISLNVAVRWSGRYFKQTGNLKFRIGVLGGARQYVNSPDNRRKGRAGKTYSAPGTLKTSKTLPGGDTFYWRFLELGAKQMSRTYPFLVATAKEKGNEAQAEFVKQYSLKLDRLLGFK